MSLTMELPCPDCGSDEVVCVVCGPLEEVVPWRKIDLDDPETWPERTPPFTYPVLFWPKGAKSRGDYVLGTIWIYNDEPRVYFPQCHTKRASYSIPLSEFSHYKPADIPEPPAK